MKKSFRLEGLDCANCAAKIEKEIKALDGVTDVTVNAMTTKMVLVADDGKMDEIIKTAEKIVKKHEPHIVMKKA
ncbi:cation transporter [Desulfitobacterium hafniense]|jgi:copper chaperone CopZ|uniref:cation transporter n=1 Tax=Desulfitobacterium hafniense TaxID=49338 RepID=UPI0003A66DDC|nr:cation transporter [Desulfitobacterium hafniense]